MHISIASDHRGLDVKEEIRRLVEGMGHSVKDEGAFHSEERVDYPDYAAAVAKQVASGQVDRGILICATGIGMSIAANKVPGARAANCTCTDFAEYSRRHNNANVLCLSADYLDRAARSESVESWLQTEFEGGRHATRVQKIQQIEQDQT